MKKTTERNSPQLCIKNSYKSCGFTLIEILVGIAIFAALVLVVGGIFMSFATSQRKAKTIQDVQENARFIVESMAKEIRMSVVNSLSPDGKTLSITPPYGEGTFNYQFGADSKLYRRGYAISSDNLAITGRFNVIKPGGSEDFSKATLVTIVMRVESLPKNVASSAVLELQVSVSKRGY